MLLYILLGIAVAVILGQAYLLYIFINRITELSDDRDFEHHRAESYRSDYFKLDKGFTEVTDAYETDSLQYEDTIEKLNALVQSQRDELEVDRIARHEQAATIDGLRRANDEYFQENRGLRRQLDISQVIISNHDLNCLPHVVLSHMEDKEKDTPLPI